MTLKKEKQNITKTKTTYFQQIKQSAVPVLEMTRVPVLSDRDFGVTVMNAKLPRGRANSNEQRENFNGHVELVRKRLIGMPQIEIEIRHKEFLWQAYQ